MFVFYDWPFPRVHFAKKPISLLILGSVFSDHVVFYGDCQLSSTNLDA